jgi:hypothetical protein
VVAAAAAARTAGGVSVVCMLLMGSDEQVHCIDTCPNTLAAVRKVGHLLAAGS